MVNTEHFAISSSSDLQPQPADQGSRVTESDQTKSLIPAAEQAVAELSYTTTAGETYKATPEDAIRKCPYLGKLPVAESNVVLSLIALGQAKTATRIERSIPKPKTNDERKPIGITQKPAKHRPNQKEQASSAEPTLQIMLAQPEREAMTPPARSVIAGPTEWISAKNRLEQAKVSELADVIALNRSNFLYAEEQAKPVSAVAAPEAVPPILVGLQHAKPPALARPIETVKPVVLFVRAESLEPAAFESLKQPELPEIVAPVDGLTLAVRETFMVLEDAQSSSEIIKSLRTFPVSESLMHETAKESGAVDEPLKTLLYESEIPPLSASPESCAAIPASEETLTIAAASLLETILPEPVHAKLEGYLGSAEPEQAARVDDLRGLIIETISQLQELAANKVAEPKKVELLEQLIEGQYRELLQELEVVVDEASFKRFIAQLRESIIQISIQEDRRAGLDEGTHEHKQNFGSIAYGLSDALTQKLLHMRLAKFAVQASTL